MTLQVKDQKRLLQLCCFCTKFSYNLLFFFNSLIGDSEFSYSVHLCSALITAESSDTDSNEFDFLPTSSNLNTTCIIYPPANQTYWEFYLFSVFSSEGPSLGAPRLPLLLVLEGLNMS